MATMNPPLTERRHIPDRRTETANLNRASTATSVDTRTRAGMSTLDWIALALMLIGGLNWGLVGLFNIDVVASLFGEMSPLSRVVYVAVALASIYSMYRASKIPRH
jgi:uncharacterized protein